MLKMFRLHKSLLLLALLLPACSPQPPAGLPALDIKLEHESQVEEAGQRRQVKAALKAVAFGSNAERLAGQALGSIWTFQGFLATPGSAKHPVLHIQDFQQD